MHLNIYVSDYLECAYGNKQNKLTHNIDSCIQSITKENTQLNLSLYDTTIGMWMIFKELDTLNIWWLFKDYINDSYIKMYVRKS